MHYESIFELLQKGGFTIYILALCSIVSLKIALDKLIQFQGIKQSLTNNLISLLKDYVKAGQFDEYMEQLKKMKLSKFGLKYSSPLIPVIQFLFENRTLPREELMESAFTKLDKELVEYEKNLGVPATLGSITPFVGLFGTVIGIIKSFSALSLQDASNYSHVINGIAEALIATAAGLFVAIPSVMIYNYFSKKLKMQMPVFDEAIHEVVRLIKK
ncbi:MAG: MotA/TolQ/ExbB proton channel family protein [Ignavibacteria bacterium]|nr:MotA/TolQ/ExbB proton channel family protein [Ignavibacteria bacterium]